MQTIFSNHNTMKLKINSWKIYRNVQIKQHTVKQPKGQRRNHKRNYKMSWDKRKWEYNLPKRMRCNGSSAKREVYSHKSLHWKGSQINYLTLHLKKLEKEEQTKPKGSKEKIIIKIRAKVNEIEGRKKSFISSYKFCETKNLKLVTLSQPFCPRKFTPQVYSLQLCLLNLMMKY